MNEEYGIKLKLITDKFKEKMQNIKDSFKGIENQEIDLSKSIKINDLKRKLEIAQKETNLLGNQYDRLREKLDKMPAWKMDRPETLKMQAELEKLGIKFDKALAKSDGLNDKLKQLESSSNKASKGMKQLKNNSNLDFTKMNTGWSKITDKIKKYALSLFGLRTIYGILSRASSAYLSQDTQLSNKLQAVWIGLGAMLEPVISKIADLMLKGVKYINIFIKALTGVDLLAKATAKSMANTNKSAKALSKTLAGFDELTNLDTSSDSNVDTSWADTLNNVDINPGFAEKVKKIAELMKPAVDRIKDFIEYVGKLKGTLENNGTTLEEFGKAVQGIGLILLVVGGIIGGFPGIVIGAVVLIVGTVIKNWEKIKETLQKGVDWLSKLQENVTQWFINNLEKIKLNFGLVGAFIVGTFITAFNWVVEIVKGAINIVIDVFDGLFTGVKQIFDGILLIFKGDFKNGFISIGKGIVNILIGIINGAIDGINAIIYPIRTLIVEAGKLLGKNWTMSNISIPKIPKLATGTNYVPEDQLAYIHQGEAVVPKKFNSDEYFGKGNEETNQLLEKVIEAVNNIEINPYTTIKDVGKTAVNYINTRNRQIGGSVIA